MALARRNPVTTKAWKKLGEHFKEVKDLEMKTLFRDDPNRGREFSIAWGQFFVDFSKNRITQETMSLLQDFAREMDLDEAIEKYFQGDKINETEGRAVMHTALRASLTNPITVDGVDVGPELKKVRSKIDHFVADVLDGKRTGHTDRAFTDVVNIGIGGSDLGPVMVTEALKYYKTPLNLHFVSNVDGDHVQEVIAGLNPETTLFIVVSKSFGTQETLSNATTIKDWFLKKAPESALPKHFVAVSSNISKVVEFGISADNIFPMWDWVGGRFSLWSAVGLSTALAVGTENFRNLLSGAEAMDRHFRETEPTENIPVILGLLSLWYNNFFKAETEAIIPYTQYLHRFPAYLQQAVMESNGKGVGRDGEKVTYQTGNIVWGEPGTNSQHAFFQLIHQGTKLIPSDFIGFKESLRGNLDHHQKLMANFFAQTKALMQGKDEAMVRAELEGKKMDEAQIQRLVPYKSFEGNRPTTTILIDKLTPETLGSLIALYEHKIFVQGVLWNIFSYDQWGVELGKELASEVLTDIRQNTRGANDSSTAQLLEEFKK